MVRIVRAIDLIEDEIFGKDACNTVINNLAAEDMVIVDARELRHLEDRCTNLLNELEKTRTLVDGNIYTSTTVTTQEVEPPEDIKEVRLPPVIEAPTELKIVLIKELNKTLQMLLENAKGSKGKQMREQSVEIGEKIKAIIR